MTRRDEHEPIQGADRELIEGMKAAYRPEPLAPNRRAALRLEIEERAQRARWSLPGPLLGLATAAVAAALAFALVPGDSPAPSSQPEGGAMVARAEPELDWVGEVFGPEDLAEDEIEDALPDEYTLIAMYFLDEE